LEQGGPLHHESGVKTIFISFLFSSAGDKEIFCTLCQVSYINLLPYHFSLDGCASPVLPDLMLVIFCTSAMIFISCGAISAPHLPSKPYTRYIPSGYVRRLLPGLTGIRDALWQKTMRVWDGSSVKQVHVNIVCRKYICRGFGKQAAVVPAIIGNGNFYGVFEMGKLFEQII
jgi:hypothetical protein